MEQKKLKKDEWAIVLDFLSHGMMGMRRSQPVAQVLGDEYFSLLEVIVRDGLNLKSKERVYIGDKKRDSIKYIRGRIEVDSLTSVAKQELPEVIEFIVKKSPERFLEFYNTSGQLTTRLHKMELLPGIGKRHLWEIIKERKEKPFESFVDLKKRVKLLPDPEKAIIKRIMDELENKDKYRLFVPRFEKRRY